MHEVFVVGLLGIVSQLLKKALCKTWFETEFVLSKNCLFLRLSWVAVHKNRLGPFLKLARPVCVEKPTTPLPETGQTYLTTPSWVSIAICFS
jgi:hypothetical protein